ncbi:hypothetical protein [Flaviaesturariibacter amylovorans]|uniref:Uncharacterized protein n=1 Tax=Flaviaesturariibacter amylovorans TaxID=1084520 RepID=A0ABP8HEH7_9BACT
MRKKLLHVLLVFTGALLAFNTADDVLSDVGTSISEVKKMTVESVYAGHFSMPWVDGKVRNACKNLPAGVREATMLSLGKVVKDYVASPEFQKDYFAYIDANVRGPELKDDEKTAAERKRMEAYELGHLKDPLSLQGAVMYLEAQSSTSKMMLDMLKDNPDMPMGKLKKSDFEHIQKEVARIRPLHESDKERFKKEYVAFKVDQELRSERMSQEQDLEANAKRKEELRDYKTIIRRELGEFLQATEGINFKAATQPKGSRIVFVDPAYEAKPNDWKFYYRCGPEAVKGARAFAFQWLKELN